MASRRLLSLYTRGRTVPELVQVHAFTSQQADHILIAVEDHAVSKLELQQSLSSLAVNLEDHTSSVAWKSGTGVVASIVSIVGVSCIFGDKLKPVSS